jgi:hypothetical protein
MPALPVLDATTLPELAAEVRPRPDEQRWLQVPWVEGVGAGRLEAVRRGRPMFLWAMNGHPLGCV